MQESHHQNEVLQLFQGFVPDIFDHLYCFAISQNWAATLEPNLATSKWNYFLDVEVMYIQILLERPIRALQSVTRNKNWLLLDQCTHFHMWLFYQTDYSIASL